MTIIALLLTLVIHQSAEVERWVPRLRTASGTEWCWDFSAGGKTSATAMINWPTLGDVMLWGLSYDEHGQPGAVTKITYLGRDDSGISLQILSIPAASRALPTSRPRVGPGLSACLPVALLQTSEDRYKNVAAQNVRLPSPPTLLRTTIGLKTIRLSLKAADDSGLIVSVLDR